MTNKEKLKKYESICLDVIQKEAIQIGTYTIELTNENGSWWGRCDTYPDGTCKIYIKEDLFGADLDESFALAIIGHELLHTSPKMKNHNRKFKKSAEKLFGSLSDEERSRVVGERLTGEHPEAGDPVPVPETYQP